MFHTKQVVWFLLGIVVLSQSLTAYSACVCNEKGTDYCETCNEHLIVRPKQKLYESNIDLPPIGDSCWCQKLKVEPASLPKPCSKHKIPTCNCNKKPTYNDHAYTAPSYPIPAVHYGPQTVKDDSLPADPISVSLAIQAGKAIEVPEAKVAYGFVQKPVDGLKKVFMSTIPEENLYKLKSEVITLKKRPLILKKDEEEEIIEEEEAEEAYPDENEQPHLTYKQLGYIPEQFKNPKFRQIVPTYTVNYGTNSYKKAPHTDCHFKPGKIIPYRTPIDADDCYE